MYDQPGYLWAIIIAGVTAIPAATCVALYGGAVRTGLGRTRATLLAGGAAVVLGGWFTASAVIAGHGWYHTRLGHGVPWMPVAVIGFFRLLLPPGRARAGPRSPPGGRPAVCSARPPRRTGPLSPSPAAGTGAGRAPR